MKPKKDHPTIAAYYAVVASTQSRRRELCVLLDEAQRQATRNLLATWPADAFEAWETLNNRRVRAFLKAPQIERGVIEHGLRGLLVVAALREIERECHGAETVLFAFNTPEVTSRTVADVAAQIARFKDFVSSEANLFGRSGFLEIREAEEGQP